MHPFSFEFSFVSLSESLRKKFGPVYFPEKDIFVIFSVSHFFVNFPYSY